MTPRPLISVVMGVRNGARDLADTMESVLSQRGPSLEVVVVNDGSNDETGVVLDGYADRDARVRVFHREPIGLTRALILGCAEARGEYIARQDCADRSLPDRFARQAALFDENPGAVMATVGARFLGPNGETVYDVSQTSRELQEGLAQTSLRTIRGPSHHGATMFRTDAYKAAGGYRAAFEVAQDLDLWLRLAALGDCVSTEQLFYEARLSPGSISQLRRDAQLQATQIILDCAALRRQGGEDAPRLSAWVESRSSRPEALASTPWRREARFHRFLGNMLRKKNPAQAREYYLQSLRAFLWQPQIWLRLMTLRVPR